MLTRPAFVQHLEQRSRFIYLGGPSHVRTQSSLLALVNAVQAYNVLANSANLQQVFLEIGNLPAPKRLKYANALSQLQQSFPHPVYVTANPFTLHGAVAAGIGVPRAAAPSSHQTDAVLALRQLHAIPAGQALMVAICNRIVASGHRVAVHPWNAQQTNNCYVAGNGDDAKTDLAVALEFQAGAAGGVIQACMGAVGHAPPLGYAWLSGQIDACPIYDLIGLPSVVPSSITHGAGWVTALMIQDWVTGVTVFPAPLVGQPAQDIRVVLGTVLRNGATANAGCHTGVRWSTASVQFNDTLGVLQVRPPFIALGHELIHAFHNLSGDQAGHEIGTYSRVLYEYLCVGLGPWAGGAHTENGLRAGAGLGARTCY